MQGNNVNQREEEEYQPWANTLDVFKSNMDAINCVDALNPNIEDVIKGLTEENGDFDYKPNERSVLEPMFEQ